VDRLKPALQTRASVSISLKWQWFLEVTMAIARNERRGRNRRGHEIAAALTFRTAEA
jgi:hypothetical protein